jgi:hypothetical protein
MTGQFETYFRCLCGTVITGARFGSRFHCLVCGRAWHIRSWGAEWWWPRKMRVKGAANGGAFNEMFME